MTIKIKIKRAPSDCTRLLYSFTFVIFWTVITFSSRIHLYLHTSDFQSISSTASLLSITLRCIIHPYCVSRHIIQHPSILTAISKGYIFTQTTPYRPGKHRGNDFSFPSLHIPPTESCVTWRIANGRKFQYVAIMLFPHITVICHFHLIYSTKTFSITYI